MSSYIMGDLDGTTRHYNENDDLHRDGGPAFIDPKLGEVWYKFGKVHRDDGPAVIHLNGDCRFYLDDGGYTFDEWCKILNKSEEDICMLRFRFKIHEFSRDHDVQLLRN